MQVLASGTKIEQDGEQNKPVWVDVVTLLVTRWKSEQLTLGATEGKIQLALRNPLDKETPDTPGIQPASLLGSTVARPARPKRHGARQPSGGHGGRCGRRRTDR